MQVKVRPLDQPVVDQPGLVGLQVVEHEVHLQARRHAALDPVEEGPELDAAVTALAGADHGAGLHVERDQRAGQRTVADAAPHAIALRQVVRLAPQRGSAGDQEHARHHAGHARDAQQRQALAEQQHGAGGAEQRAGAARDRHRLARSIQHDRQVVAGAGAIQAYTCGALRSGWVPRAEVVTGDSASETASVVATNMGCETTWAAQARAERETARRPRSETGTHDARSAGPRPPPPQALIPARSAGGRGFALRASERGLFVCASDCACGARA